MQDGPEIAGFSLRDSDTLAALYLTPVARRQGLGRRLLKLAQEGQPELTLWAFEANADAIAFYAACGFGIIGRTPGDNAESLPDVQMRWTEARP